MPEPAAVLPLAPDADVYADVDVDVDVDSVATRIVDCLEASEMTKSDLARKLAGPDLTEAAARSLISKWTSGKVNPGRRHAERLAVIFDKPEDYFRFAPNDSDDQLPSADADSVTFIYEVVGVETDEQLPPQIDRETIAQRLARHFYEEHILLDKITSYEPLKSATAEKTWTEDELGLAGRWYKDSDAVPGLLITEALAQTAAAALLTHERYTGRIVMVTGYDEVRIRRAVRVGHTLTLKATVHTKKRARQLATEVAYYDVKATRGKEQVASGTFTLAVAPKRG